MTDLIATTDLGRQLVASELQSLHDMPSENSLLLALIQNPLAIADVRQIVRIETFGVPDVANIFSVMLAIADGAQATKSQPSFDLNTMGCWAGHRNVPLRTARLDYALLHDAATATDSVIRDTMSIARVVRDNSARRHLYYALRQLQMQLDKPLDQVLADAQMVMDRVRERVSDQESQSLLDGLHESMADQTTAPTNLRMATFCRAVGIRRGRLVIFKGKMKGGKTRLVADTAVGFAEAGIPVLWLCSEMQHTEHGERVCAMLAKLDVEDLRKPENMDRVREAEARLRAIDPLIQFERLTNHPNACASIRDFARRTNGAGVVFYDWLVPDFSIAPQRTPEFQVLSVMAQQLKRLAQYMKIAIVAGNQDNRDVAKATHQQKVQAGEQFQAGSINISRFADATASIRELDEDLKAAIQATFPGCNISHFITVDLNRHGRGRSIIPLREEGIDLVEVNDAKIVNWLRNPPTKRENKKAAPIPIADPPIVMPAIPPVIVTAPATPAAAPTL